MIIRNKIELAVFYQSGDDPFICGINGMIDTISLNEIEMDLVGDAWDFEDGSGTYFFEAERILEQVGDGGRIEIGAHWELAQMYYEPIQIEKSGVDYSELEIVPAPKPGEFDDVPF